MKSDNNNQSPLESFLNKNKSEASTLIDLASTSKSNAPLLNRIGAAIVDSVIVFFIGKVGVDLILKMVTQSNLGSSYFHFILQFIYAGYFYSVHSATPGKLMFQLQVVTNSGDPLDFVKAGFRDTLGKWISALPLGLGFWMVFFRTDRRTLHDLIFKTYVVSKD